MLLFFLLPLPALLQVVDALLNVTVDDVSPMISYSGIWEPSSSHLSGLDLGGSHTLSSDSSASATFLFTGVAVYYLSPRWPYDVSTRLSLDGAPSVLVNLTDPSTSPSPPGGSESALSSAVWSATGLANTSHTLIATYGNYIIVDGFIYTVDNGTSSLSSSASSSSTSSLSSSSSSSLSSSLSASATLSASSAGPSTIPSNNRSLAIGLGSAFGLAVFIAGALLVFAFYQRRRALRARSARPQSGLSDWNSYMRGRGRYAPVAVAHTLESSDASSRLLYPPSSSGYGNTDPWAPEDEHGGGYMPASVSSSRSQRRPPGAMLPAVPGPYVDRLPPEDEDGDAAGASLNRAPSSHEILFSVHPMDSPGAESDFRISGPPAYEERERPGAG
ncbi:hypothetical protein DFH06DRAFT_752458 [Mycena polygramma]|nr:hypothetical protein DFH06DRAFT_752458 [Mycena polygramma]